MSKKFIHFKDTVVYKRTRILAELEGVAKGTARDLGDCVHRHVPDVGVHRVKVLLEASTVSVIDGDDDVIDRPLGSRAAFKTHTNNKIQTLIYLYDVIPLLFHNVLTSLEISQICI